MSEPTSPSRVSATPAALELIARLKAQHGEILFHQTGGCCEGSAPLCLLVGELSIGAIDVELGAIGGVPFYMSRAQFAFWEHTHLIIDAIPGGGSNAFSLDGGSGWAFITRSRLYRDDEWAVLSRQVV
ncbi:MAG TPA: DUF779 domain-containing protein [Rhodocyclaceae bacterium]|nr:DUF779 domain-containing protein [Rhodocyclaceae bacterium]